MIQRIQSLYLLIAIALMSCATKLPLLDIFSEGKDYIFNASGIHNGEETLLNTVPLLILLIVTIIIDVITLFAYKKRFVQIRLLSFSMILKVGFYGLAAFYVFQIKGGENFAMKANVTTVFPAIAIILSYLAYRGIIKDEALVKSLDRIR